MQATSWPALLTALAAGVIGGASIGKMSPALPFITDEFGLSLVASGWLISMFNVIALAGAGLFGIASDRVGAYRFCIAGLAIQIAGGALGCFAPNAGLLLFSRVFEGIGFVTTAVAAPVLMASAASAAHRGFAFGLWGTQMPVGSALMILASPAILAHWGWRGVWIALAFVALAVLVALVRERPRYASARGGTPRSLADIRSTLRQPVPWLLGTAFAVYTLQFFTVMVWLPTYLLQTRDVGPLWSSLLTAAFIVANACGNFAGSLLVHRRLPRGPTIGTSLAFTAVLFVGIFSSSLPDTLRFSLVLLYGLATGVIPPMCNSAMATARTPAEAGAIQGLVVQVSNIGTFIGPPIIASVVTATGSWESSLWVVLAAASLGVLAAWRIHRIESTASPRRVTAA